MMPADWMITSLRAAAKSISKKVDLGRRPELVGGGLLRSSGGWGVLKAMSKARIHLKGHPNIDYELDFICKCNYSDNIINSIII